MKLLFVFASLLILQSAYCQDGGEVTGKTCEDFLSADTCQKLRDLATALHEKVSIVSDAVQSAIAHHKTKASEMLAYIKEYMAERFPCEKVLTPNLCSKLFDLGQRVKLTANQVRMAIENAIASGKSTVTGIYNKAVDFMTTQITCANIFSETSCNNMKAAIKKFGEQVSLLKEAIMSAAKMHITNAKDMLVSVKNTIVSHAQNFTCEKVLPAATCDQIRNIGTQLHLTAKQVRTAIEEAVVNGALTAKAIYDKTINFMTTQINCNNILGETACNNLVEAAKRLHEQSKLIQEAIMSAVLKHANNAKDILVNVKNTLIEKATNFKCSDVLSESQCNFLKDLAVKFKLQAGELHRVLVETIVNGTQSAVQIYKVTIGKFIEDAKNVKCEDLISAKACGALDAFAKNFHMKLSQVTLAVKEAVANGLTTTAAIVNSAREFLAEKLSCDKLLGESVCDKLEYLANKLHVNFKKVTDKLRELVASGVNSVVDLYKKVTSYIWNLFWGTVNKRSLDITSFTDTIMQMVEKVVTIGNDVKEKLKVEIKKAIEQGKVTLLKIREYVSELIAKYGPQGDEVAEDDTFTDVITQLKEALKKAHGKAKEKIEELLAKSKEQLQKLKNYIKSILGSSDVSDDALEVTYDIFADAARKELDEELKMAEDEVESFL